SLNATLPTSVQSLEDMPYERILWEEDVTQSKATFPEMAHNIKPISTGVAELELDRTARLNVQMNMGVGYTTGDTLERQCTRAMWFLRPALFMEFSKPEKRDLRDRLLAKFPDGVMVDWAGSELI